MGIDCGVLIFSLPQTQAQTSGFLSISPGDYNEIDEI